MRLSPAIRYSLCLLLLCALVGGWTMAAQAQTASPTPQARIAGEMIGQWELSTTERGKTCVVTLKPDSTTGGMKLELEPTCGAALAFTKDIAAWSVRGLTSAPAEPARRGGD